jgi:hypothetical protein
LRGVALLGVGAFILFVAMSCALVTRNWLSAMLLPGGSESAAARDTPAPPGATALLPGGTATLSGAPQATPDGYFLYLPATIFGHGPAAGSNTAPADATPAPTPVPTQGKGAPISAVSLAGQEVLRVEGRTFVSRLTFTIATSGYEGLSAELDGVTTYPAACNAPSCTFELSFGCDQPDGMTMIFHSGVFWYRLSFAVTKPPECG